MRVGRGLERRLEQLLGIPGSSWRFKRTAKNQPFTIELMEEK